MNTRTLAKLLLILPRAVGDSSTPIAHDEGKSTDRPRVVLVGGEPFAVALRFECNSERQDAQECNS